MPHARKRLALSRLQKKLAFFPVVAIQGARQTGKSFLAREFLTGVSYQSFDHATVAAEASRAPHTFLTDHGSSGLLVIDEAQKVPGIFDAIKFEVDQERRPGRFLLLGSTEFSRLTRIRESLTGRMGRIRLFPLTLAETIGLESLPAQFRRKQTLDYLAHGGMPGLFAVRDEEEREALVQDWLDLTCYRDLQQFKDHKLDGDLAFEILKLSATLEEPTRAAMTKSLRADPRRIETHLKALCALFALQRINPHPSGTGKPIYLLLDAGIAEFLGASRLRRLHIWLMIERMAKNSYNREKRKSFTYYRSSGKKMIHWVEEGIDQNPRAFQLMDEERIRKIDAALMEAFLVKNPSAAGTILAPIPAQQKIGKSQFLPWEELPHLK